MGQRQLLGFTVDSRVIPIGPIALRPLGVDRAAIMDVHIRSKRGVDDKAAGALAAEAGKIAAGHPQDPFVQTTLAEAEYDAKNYAAAEVAADRALAADPRDVQALIYKGRARMALAKANPAGPNWDEVRSWFLKANKVDTENAEPLLLFFRTYSEAGQRPTRNAVDALLYAVDLAPRDDEVRLNAVRQLLIDSRFGEAEKMFAPIAFQPHLSEAQRERNAKIVAAIAARDTTAALRLIDASG
jgi:tetratricopeptide (TPR) repeat protein